MSKNGAYRVPSAPGMGNAATQKPNDFKDAIKKLAGFMSPYKATIIIAILIASI